MRYLIDERVSALNNFPPIGGPNGKHHPIGTFGLAQIFELTTQRRGETNQRPASGTKVVVPEVVGDCGALKKRSASSRFCCGDGSFVHLRTESGRSGSSSKADIGFRMAFAHGGKLNCCKLEATLHYLEGRAKCMFVTGCGRSLSTCDKTMADIMAVANRHHILF